MDKILNLIELAKDEINAENYKEAERLINEVLIEDREQVEAWIVKAKIAYYQDSGLSTSYKYLTNAFNAKKSDDDIKSILDAFSFVTSKELKWYMGKALDDLPENNGANELCQFAKKFNDIAKPFLSLFSDQYLVNKALCNAKNEYIKYSITEISKKWEEIERDYYQNAYPNRGKSWETNNEIITGNYRPGKYDFDRFTASANALSGMCTYVSFFSNDECDFDGLISLLRLANIMIERCLSAVGYEVRQHAEDVNDDEGELLYVDYQSRWDIVYLFDDKTKNGFRNSQRVINSEIDVLVKNKKRIELERKQKEREKYWANHQEEYAKLLAEKDATIDQKAKLQARYDEIEKEIEALDMEKYDGSVEMAKLDEMKEELNQRKQEHKKTSILRFKKRKEEKKVISETKNKMNEIDFARIMNRSRFQQQQNEQIGEKKLELHKIKIEIDRCNEILASIEKRYLGE